MDDKRLAVAAVIWSVGVFVVTYLYRFAITDTFYVRNVTIERSTQVQPISQH